MIRLPSAVVATAQGIGGPQVDVVQQHRVQQLLRRHVDDAQRVGVHPAPFQLRGRHLVAGQDLGDVGVRAIGRDADFLHAGTAVGQADLRSLQRAQVDHRHFGRHVVRIGSIDRQQVADESQAAVGRDGDLVRFADRLDTSRLLVGLQVDHRHVVVETVADQQPLAARHQGGSARRVPDRDRRGDLAGRHVDDTGRALDAAAGDVQLGAVGRHGQARRSRWTSDRLGDVAARHIDDQDLPSVGREHKQALPIRGGNHIDGTDVLARFGGQQRRAQETGPANGSGAQGSGGESQSSTHATTPIIGSEGWGSRRGEAGRELAGPRHRVGRTPCASQTALMVSERHRNSERVSDLTVEIVK